MLVPERYRGHHPNHVKRFFDSPEPRRLGIGREFRRPRGDWRGRGRGV
jgi:hypothetical protein